MFDRIIVPIDGSGASWRAAPHARRLATAFDAELELVEVVLDPPEIPDLEERLARQAAEVLGDRVSPICRGLVMGDSVVSTLACHVEQAGNALVVMSTHGRGRSAAVLGSVANHLLLETFGPIALVGPHCDDDEPLEGRAVVVPIDGSKLSEAMLPLAAAWSIELRTTPWVVTVATPELHTTDDISESSYPANRARRLRELSHHEVEFEVLHDEHAARAIVDFTKKLGAALVMASTHGRTGVHRFTAGSVAMDVVRHSPCPVVLGRPPREVFD